MRRKGAHLRKFLTRESPNGKFSEAFEQINLRSAESLSQPMLLATKAAEVKQWNDLIMFRGWIRS
ncbi:MAG: hypothetical protein ACTS5F_00600 [Candidatus Hodgkinia cicadicola]